MSLQKTILNVAPFYDDFDESKNFHRVLFQPSRAVQARELTQAQTILQEQIDRFGRHFFNEGSVVIPGGISTNASQDMVVAALGGNLDATFLQNNIETIYIKSNSTGIEASLVKYVPVTQSSPAAFAVIYQKTANDGVTRIFSVGETCTIVNRVGGVDTFIQTISVTSTNLGLYVSVLPGVYFVRGHMVQCSAQDIVASPFANTGTVHVGFEITETIVTELTDSSLYSNAIGSPNYKAPGAARLQITLGLNSYIGDYNDTSFVEIVTFVNGEVQNIVNSTDYSYLLNTIAQRQYETNGNFTLNKFPLSMYNHLRDASHTNGIYTAAQGGDSTKVVYRLGKGVAYTSGFRTEVSYFQDVIGNKALATNVINNAVLPTQYGSYIVVQNMASAPIIDIKKKYLFLDSTNTQIGTFLVRSAKQDSATTLRLYIMDMRFNTGKTIANVAKVKYTDASNLFTANVSSTSVFSSSNDSLIFPMPYDSVKSFSGTAGVSTSYSVVRNYDILLNSSGIGTVSLTTNEYFLAINPFDYFVALTGVSTPGTEFNISTLSLGGTGGNKTLTVNVGATFSGQTVRVICPIYKAVTAQKTKTLKTNTETITFAGNSSILAKADINKIVSVIDQSNMSDVTVLFGFKSGSRPNWYENGSVFLGDGSYSSKTYAVTYQYFQHSLGDYFNIDSYGGMLREQIPFSSDTADQTMVSLADCIDFRPLRDSSLATPTVIGDFSTASWVGDLIDPNDNIRYNLTYYTNRIDILYSSPDGTFGIAQGTPGDNPQPPTLPDNVMSLFQFYVPAYTLDVSLITSSAFDNRRYTMRDIGKLEGRISNLEYYTSLNLLESKVDRTQVIDPATGLNRFKNGFTADGFKNTVLADVQNPLWQASMDLKNGLLLGSFIENPADLVYQSGTNMSVQATAIMGFSTTPSISQTLATDIYNVNPFAAFTWAGDVQLVPSSDFWKDTVYLPPILNNVSGGAIGDSDGNPSGPSQQQIDDYNYSVLHKTVTANLIPTQDTINQITANVNTVGAPGKVLTWIEPDGSVVGIANKTILYLNDLPVPSWAITPYTVTINTPTANPVGYPNPPAGVPIASPTAAASGATTRWGITDTSTYDTISYVNSDALLSEAVIPYMRTITINFSLTGFRPFTKLYAFFNGISVDSQITQILPTPTALGVNVVVDAAGAASGTFTIPNSATLKFPVGQATLRFTDNASNGLPSFTSGQRLFTSGGILDTRQITSTATTTTHIRQDWGWVSVPEDPIAQTFFVADNTGIWVPKIDIYFASKANTLPVTLQIRSVVAGVPTNLIANFGQCVLNPSQVNVSADGTVPTSFTFPDPVYLEGNTEYAIVLLSDTTEYTVYIATMGHKVLSQNLNVASQPNIGVFLTSSNASTWTPDQVSDLTFVVHKCVFNTATSSQVVFKSTDPNIQLSSFNPLFTTSGSSVIKAVFRSHGLLPGDNVVITQATGGNGLTDAQVTGTFTVVTAGNDYLTFNAPVNANATGSIGGLCGFTTNYPFTEFRTSMDQITLPGTSILWEFQHVSQNGRVTQPWQQFSNSNVTQGLLTEGVIRTGSDLLVRATLTTTDANLTPQIDTHGLGLQLIERRLSNDYANPMFNYLTSNVILDTPSTTLKIYSAVNLPGSTSMRVFYKFLASGSDNVNNIAWTECFPTVPIVNQLKGFVEYEYDVTSTVPFIGFKVMIQFYGPDPIDCPIAKDFRTICLA